MTRLASTRWQLRRAIAQLHEILRGYPGEGELQLVLCLADGNKVYMKSDRMRVGIDTEMRTRIDDLLGPGNFRLMTAPPRPMAGTR